MEFSLEVKYEIWNDKSGEHLEIRKDCDGLDLIEIRSFNDSGKIDGSLTFTQEQAVLVADALKKAVGVVP